MLVADDVKMWVCFDMDVLYITRNRRDQSAKPLAPKDGK